MVAQDQQFIAVLIPEHLVVFQGEGIVLALESLDDMDLILILLDQPVQLGVVGREFLPLHPAGVKVLAVGHMLGDCHSSQSLAHRLLDVVLDLSGGMAAPAGMGVIVGDHRVISSYSFIISSGWSLSMRSTPSSMAAFMRSGVLTMEPST